MKGIEVSQVISDTHAATFMQVLAKSYQDHALRPYLCRLTCIVHEHVKYLAATDGVFLIALPTNPELEIGDYEGVPYLVKMEDTQLYRRVSVLLDQLSQLKRSDFRIDENAYEMRAHILDSFFGEESLGTDVLLAHVASEEFTIDMERPHTHIVSRELYERAADAVGGFFDYVRHGDPNTMMAFFSKAERGFAMIMPMKPDCKIKKMQSRY